MTETTGAAEAIQKELVRRVIFDIKKGSELADAFDVDIKSLEFVHVAKSLKHFFADKFRLRESKFSKFIGGQNTLSPEELDGGLIFYGKGKCSSCHRGPHFSDFDFHTIVMPQFGFGKNGSTQHSILMTDTVSGHHHFTMFLKRGHMDIPGALIV